jgi:hypothetical protein
VIHIYDMQIIALPDLMLAVWLGGSHVCEVYSPSEFTARAQSCAACCTARGDRPKPSLRGLDETQLSAMTATDFAARTPFANIPTRLHVTEPAVSERGHPYGPSQRLTAQPHQFLRLQERWRHYHTDQSSRCIIQPFH